MNNVMEVAFSLKGILDNSFINSFKNARKNLDGLTKSFKETAFRKVKLDEVIRKREEVLKATNAFNEQKKKLNELQKELKNTVGSKTELQNAIRKQISVVNSAENSLNKNKQALKSLEQDAGSASKSLNNLTKEQLKLQKALEKKNKLDLKIDNLEKTKESIDKIKEVGGNLQLKGAARIGKSIASAVALFGKPLKDAMALENQEAELGKFSDKAKEIMEMNKELAKSYAISTESMMQMQTAAMQSNILDPTNLSDIKEYTETSAKAMVAMGLNADEVGESFSNIKNKIDGTMQGTVLAFDLVNQLSNNTNAGAKDILEVLNRTGGAVKALTGMQTAEVIALSTAFRSASVSAEVAATAQGSFINTLTIGTNATKSQQEGFAALGIDAEKTAKQMVAGPEQARAVIFDVLERIKGLSKEKQSSVIGQIFGNDSGIKTAIATLASQVELIKKPFDIAADSVNYLGSMQKEYDSRADTTANHAQILMNSLSILSGEIGQAVLPIFNDLVTSISGIIQSIVKWVNENRQLVKDVLIIAASLIALNATIGAISFVFGTLIKAITIFKPLLTALITVVRIFNLTLLANPLVAIVTAVLAVGAAVYMLIKHFDKVKAYFTNLWNTFKAKCPILANAIENVFNAIKNLISPFLGTIKNALTTVINFIVSFYDSVFNILSKVYHFIADIFAKIGITFESVGAFVESAKQHLMNFFNIVTEIFGYVVNNIGTAFDKIGNIFSTAFEFISNIVKTIVDTIKGMADSISNIFSTIYNTIKDTITSTVNAFLGFIDFIKNLFTSMWSSAWQGVSDAFKSIFNPIVDFFDGIIQAIVGKFRAVKDFAVNVVDNVKSFFGFGDDTNINVNKNIAVKSSDFRQSTSNLTPIALPNNSTINNFSTVKENNTTALNIPKLATGGIVDKATLALIGEGRENEVVMPLSKLNEFANTAGQNITNINNFDNRKSTRSTNSSNAEKVVLNFNPTINIQGGNNTSQDLQEILLRTSQQIEQKFNDFLRNRERLRYV